MTLHNSTHFWNGKNLGAASLSATSCLAKRIGRPIRRADTSLYYSSPIVNQDNLVCVKFFSKSLKTAKTNVNVVRGRTSITKTVEIHHTDAEGWKKILELLGD